MKKIFFVILALLAAPMSALTLDELVAKNLEARGGAEAWAKVEAMTLTGTFTAFSKTSSFTWHRTRDNKMRIECRMIDLPVTIGYDGANVWQQSPMSGPWPEQPSGVERTHILQDVEFVNPLYGWKEKGYELTLVGDAKVDGMAAIQVDIKHPDASEESWYFDPETHLEIARDGVGSEGPRAFPLRTIFDDFRPVEGVLIPHWIETEWYTRHRVYEVENVEINPTLDPSLFTLPVATGMEKFQGMVGTWDVKVEVRRRPDAPWSEESRASSMIEAFMNGALIREHYKSENSEVMRSLSYDPFKETYRMTSVHGQRPYQDVLEGNWTENEEGPAKLTLDDAKTDTSFNMYGQTMHSGWAIGEVTADGFVVELSTSRDGGENWFNNVRLTYAKPGTLGPAPEAAAE